MRLGYYKEGVRWQGNDREEYYYLGNLCNFCLIEKLRPLEGKLTPLNIGPITLSGLSKHKNLSTCYNSFHVIQLKRKNRIISKASIPGTNSFCGCVKSDLVIPWVLGLEQSQLFW